jgi:transcriptional regulator with XRE-family HTH domain
MFPDRCHNELLMRKPRVYLAMDSEQVRSLREQKRMSQRQLAEASDVSKKKTLANAQTGKKTYTLPETAHKKIGVALDVDPRSLVTVAPRA